MSQLCEIDGLTYEINSQSSTAKIISACNAKGDINIPRSIIFSKNEYIITTISENSFKNNLNIDSIVIQEDSEISLIDKSSFFSSSLKSIFIPTSIIQIAEYSFSQCKNLKSIIFSINSRLQSIGKFAFSKSSISNISFPSNVIQIEEGIFSQCVNLKSVKFSSNCQFSSIPKEMFSESSIENIEIPSRVSKIEEDSFAFCLNLKRIGFSMNSNLNYISQCAFRESSLETISIPSKVKIIRKQTFDTCMNLKSIEFLAPFISIEDFSFDKSPQLFLISFPNSHQIVVTPHSFCSVSNNFSLFCFPSAKLSYNSISLKKKYLCGLQ